MPASEKILKSDGVEEVYEASFSSTFFAVVQPYAAKFLATVFLYAIIMSLPLRFTH